MVSSVEFGWKQFLGFGFIVGMLAFVQYGWAAMHESIRNNTMALNAFLAALVLTYFVLMKVAMNVTFIDAKKPKSGEKLSTDTTLGFAKWWMWQTFTHSMILGPLAFFGSFALGETPTIKDALCGIFVHFLLTCFPMSVMLHRFFSHGAYKANRAVTFVLAVLSCLAYQYGPIWWSSKHRRHHKECDKPADPHSWAQFGLGYAWIGWTMHPAEHHIDMEFVHPVFKVGNNKDGKLYPELKFIDDFFFLPTWSMHLLLIFGFGVPLHTVIYRYTLPSCLCAIATLWFNCKFHPPVEASALTKSFCNSIDLLHDPLAAMHGEAYHKDHHTHPRRAKRPGPDLGWYLAIKPLLALGIIQSSKGVNKKGLM